MPEAPGLVVLFGSGETTPSGRKIFDWLFRRLPVPAQVAILETPAGFELNSPQVAGRIGDFLQQHLQNYRPQITIVPARKRGTPFSPDEPAIAGLLLGSDAIFVGPGSPTYAVRQLQDSLLWKRLRSCHASGTALVSASAGTIALGARALPVYEIFKVGEDLHWRGGLDFLAAYGLSVVFVPHWNNQDGGSELDTSRCYMGQARFEALAKMLPAAATVVGIDERTALALDLVEENCQVVGKDGVTVFRGGKELRYAHGQAFPIRELGGWHKPETQGGIDAGDCQATKLDGSEAWASTASQPPAEVMALVMQREARRTARDWEGADALRAQVSGLGWQVLDTPDGPLLEPLDREAG